MFCCCREELDITDVDAEPAHYTKKAGGTARDDDREKEKAFSEAVTAHPSPAVSPATKPADHRTSQSPVAAGHAPQPQSVNRPPPAASSVTVQPAVASSAPVAQPSAVEETVKQSAIQSVESAPIPTPAPTNNNHHSPGPNVSVISVAGSGAHPTKGDLTAVASSSSPMPSNQDQVILGQIEVLSQSIERAAERGELKGRAACRGFATQLCDLTSQVRQAAAGSSSGGSSSSSGGIRMSESALQSAVARLESVASRLESLAGRGGAGSGGDGGATASFVLEFDAIISGAVAKFLALSNTIGGDVKTQAGIVKQAFDSQRQFLVVASKSKAPAAAALDPVVQPVAEKLTAVQEFREKNRKSELFNHLSAISESIAALGWITVTPAPGPYVKEMKDAGQFYANRVLKDFKEKDGGATHVEWVKAWLGTLNELQDYIKNNHTTGVTWNSTGGDAAAAATAKGRTAPPPPPGGPPPPPPPGPPPPSSNSSGGEDSRSALFASLNRGETVTTGLRKVTDDMKTHKNPGLRQGPAPFKSATPTKPVAAPKPMAVAKAAPAKPPLTELQNKKWVVEYHTGNKGIVLDQTELKQAVYAFKCVDCVIQVKGKINSIILDSCKKTAVVFDDLVASLEFVNCQSMQAQVTGRVPTISIDKTDGCMIYLSKNSLDTEIVTAKSSEMNILIPQGDGDYKEFALPEQFKTTWNGKSMVTVQTDSV